ncbi:MAG: DUF3592 domain-containing protein [Pseudomonadota bacterium]
MSQGDRIHLFFAAGVFLLLSLAGSNICYSAVKDFAFARASGKWIQTDGVVLSPTDSSEKLRYAYISGGRQFESHRLSFLTRGRIGTMPPTWPGANVTVYVSPENPAVSVLVPGGSGRRFAVWFAFGGLVVFVGLGGMVRTMMAVDFPELDIRPQSVEGLEETARDTAYSPAE